MPTLQDVAERAGVSTATVSKVLSNTPYVSEETRLRVLKAVDEIGYRPNLAARALSSGKTSIIAVVFPYIYDAIFKDPLVMHILEGVEGVCTEKGYNILLSTPRLTNDGAPDEQYMQLLSSGFIEGLIAIDNVEVASFTSVASKLGVPSVTLGYHPGTCNVHSDDFMGGKLMMQEVLAHGHEEIGIITTAHAMNIAIRRRVEGMQAAMREQGKNFEALPMVHGDFSTRSGAKAADYFVEKYPNMTAIISVNDRMAIGAIAQLQLLGRAVPKDISVTGYDNIAISGVSNPPLTTIDQKPVDLGRVAAERLFLWLEGKEPSSVVIPPELIKRGSLVKRR